MKKGMSQFLAIVMSASVVLATAVIRHEDNGPSLPVNGSTQAKSELQEKNGAPLEIDPMMPMERFSQESKPTDKTPDKAPDKTQDNASSSTTAGSEGGGDASSSVTKTTTAFIPDDESANEKYIKDPDYISPYYIVVYTGSQSTVVYGKDSNGAYNKIIKAFTVSTGKIGVTPTRKGLYRIRAKYRWRRLMNDCYGQYCSSISPDYLFHSVPYAERSVNSLYNGSYNNLGRSASHGCIRMCVRDVKWIYDNCPIGTQVHIVWEKGPAGAGVPKRKGGAKYSGWDPSDQWAKGNPYFEGVTTTESEPVTTVETKRTMPTGLAETEGPVTSATSAVRSTTSTTAASSTQGAATTASTSADKPTDTSSTEPGYDSSAAA